MKKAETRNKKIEVRYRKIHSDNPRGDWVLIRLFLPKGGDDGEVFLNLNPVLGKAGFSIKGSDYGNFLMEQLAKVL